MRPDLIRRCDQILGYWPRPRGSKADSKMQSEIEPIGREIFAKSQRTRTNTATS